MKIMFLCGGLEPGSDGVGDYTRLLSIELIKLGHQIHIVALNDSFITDTNKSIQRSKGIEVEVLRMPSVLSIEKKSEIVKNWVNDLNPDWISLQYVPFSFHSKGIPFGLSKALNRLGKGRKWNIMFHELWVGLDNEATPKMILWGHIQRLLIRKLVQVLQPKIIHTHTKVYQAILQKNGFEAKYLPLFSNIPVNNEPNSGVKKDSVKENNFIRLVIFGSLHPEAPVGNFADEVVNYSNKYKTQITLTFIGRSSNQQAVWEAIWTEKGLTFENLGEGTPEYISSALSNCSIGISTTPISLIEKSGAVAAMREHGLPVICVARPLTPRGIKNTNVPLDVLEYKKGNLELLLAERFGILSEYKNAEDVSKQLLRDF
ncbi:MAG: hypothetical protein H7Y07_16990 [Pyrinomonadaceae bacterium]|nr:hypothetical protein [Sphingobacteriaceae bacterium]